MVPPKKNINVSENDTQRKMPKRKQRLPLKTPIAKKTFLSEHIISTTMPNTKLNRKKKNMLEKLGLTNEVAMSQLINQPIAIDNVAENCASQEQTKQKRWKKNKLEKLDLANEVARAQLTDQPTVIYNVAESCASCEKTKIKLKEEIEKPSIPVVRKSCRKRKPCEIDVFPSKVSRKRKATDTAEKCEPKQKMSKITKKSTVVKNCRFLRSSKDNKGKETDNVVNEVSSILDLNSQVVKDENKYFVTNNNKRPHYIDKSDKLSWAEIAANSSTTTCITANSSNVVSINGKMPILKLTDIKSTKNNAEKKKKCLMLPESVTSCGSSAEFTSNNELLSRNRNLAADSIRLSYSSTGSICEDTKEKVKKIKKKQTLEQLSQILKTFDLEFVNWVAYENQNTNPNVQKLTEQIFEYLKEENEILASINRVKSVLLESNGNKSPPPNDTEASYRYSSPIVTSDGETNSKKKNVINDVSLSKANKDGTSDEEGEDNDDSISLFAESITGIESSNMSASESVSNVRKMNNEEYVPQSLSSNGKSPEFTYQPTKITERSCSLNEIDTKLSKGVCEKQNADSTSINRELPNKNIADRQDTHAEDLNYDLTERAKFISEHITQDSNVPHLLAHLNFSPMLGVKSVVFKGVCFYNLISECIRTKCYYPHKNLDITVLLARLSSVSNKVFIEEYMLLRNWPGLRRLYSTYFVKKCIEKKLTRVLVEMALDSVIRAEANSLNDELLKVHIIEYTLLYLNNIDLKKCDDLLKYNVGNDTLLCDVFMEIIAETQNFSRFKPVFINLTLFIISLDRGFKLHVAKHILERVCILPPDVPIYGVLVKIVRHTDRLIFGSHMMEHFENQLHTLNTELYVEFLDYKNKVVVDHTVGVQPMHTSECSQEPEMVQTTAAVHAVNGNRNSSPDTTQLDSLVKRAREPVQEAAFRPIITRTINGCASTTNINVQNHSHAPYSVNEHNCNSSSISFYRTPTNQFQRPFNQIGMPNYWSFRPPAPRPQEYHHPVAFRGPMPNFIGRQRGPRFQRNF